MTIFNPLLKAFSRLLVRNLSTQESSWWSNSNVRTYKRIFSFVLFGSTISGAYYLKHRKRLQFKEISTELTYLKDYPFGNIALYEYKDYVLGEPVVKVLRSVQNFKFRETDVVLSSFPKTGTAWLSEIVYILRNPEEIDQGFKNAKTINITDRVPYMEFPVPGLDWIGKQTGDRVIKTHLSPKLLFEKQEENFTRPKVISIFRDPRDVCVSFYHFARMNSLINYKNAFSEFFVDFMGDKIPYGPIWKFYSDFKIYELKNPCTSLIIYYEDLQTNFASQIDKLCEFLCVEKLDPEHMKLLKDHCNFDSMKANPSVNYQHWDDLGIRNKGESHFMRKGIIGDWKNHFSHLHEQGYSKWLRANFSKNIKYNEKYFN